MNNTRVTINDPLFVKNLERRLGRKLTDEELMDEELALFIDGRREFIVIPKLIFPDDLLSRPDKDIGMHYNRMELENAAEDVKHLDDEFDHERFDQH